MTDRNDGKRIDPDYEMYLINAIEWAVNVGETATHDLLRAIAITSEDLEAIGYDRANFPKMHEMLK